MFNINFANDWIRTANQYDHHHGPCSTPLKCLVGSLGQDEYFRIERKRKICKRWRMRQIKKEPAHWPDQQKTHTGSGCGSVGKAVASNTRGLRYESSHQQKLYWTLFTVSCQEKTKIKKKRPGMAHLKKSLLHCCPAVLNELKKTLNELTIKGSETKIKQLRNNVKMYAEDRFLT